MGDQQGESVGWWLSKWVTDIHITVSPLFIFTHLNPAQPLYHPVPISIAFHAIKNNFN